MCSRSWLLFVAIFLYMAKENQCLEASKPLKTVQIVKDGDVPYHVMLIEPRNEGGGFSWATAGIVIDKRTVLVPGNYMERYNPSLKHYIVISTNRLNPIDLTESSVYEVRNYTLHPGFQTTNLKDNIAVIQIRDEFKEGINLKPAKIASEPINKNRTCSYSFTLLDKDWGLKYDTYKTDVIVSNWETCLNLFPFWNYFYNELSICASNVDNFLGCFREGGGILMCDDEIVGLRSVQHCGDDNMFVELYHYRDWIQQFVEINHEPIQDKQAPFQALLLYKNSANMFVRVSSGIIISKRTVIVPAHRLNKSYNATDYYIFAGRITSNEAFNSENLYQVQNMKIHEKFHLPTFINDIALIEMSHDFPEGANLEPSTISDSPVSGVEKCSVIAWRKIFDGWYELRKLDVDVLNRTVCMEKIDGFSIEDPENRLCVKVMWNVDFGLPYDAGVPLVCNDKVVGLGSYVYEKNGPNLFVNLNNYREWIAENSSVSLISNLVLILSVLLLHYLS